ncbi:MAG: hypothetical protein ACOZF0_13560 [Thermodesulfobacteriota bacterium]
MRTNTILILAGFFFVCCATAQAVQQTSPSNRWPYDAPKAIAVSDDYVFFGTGNIVRFYDKETLYKNRDILIDTSEGITGLHYDATSRYLYVTSGHSGLYKIDTANPGAAPVNYIVKGNSHSEYSDDASTRTEPDKAIIPRSRGVYIANGTAYVPYTKIIANSNAASGIELVNVSGTGDMNRISAADIPSGVTIFTDARGVGLYGNTAFLIDVVNGLVGFNLTDPANPVGVYWDNYIWIVSKSILDVAIQDTYAYSAGGAVGLWIGAIGQWIADPTNTNGNDLIPSTFLYNGAMKYTDGTNVLDSSRQPVSNPVEARSISVNGNYAYIADARTNIDDYLELIEVTPDPSKTIVPVDSGLRIINVEDRANPRIVGTYNADFASVYSVCYADSTVYLADRIGGLVKINVATPEAPTPLASQTETPANCHKLLLFTESNTSDKNLYAYALDSNGAEEGLRILRFTQEGGIADSEFSNIQLQSFTKTPGEARDVFVAEVGRDNTYNVYAFIADGSNGLLIYNVDQKNLANRTPINSDTLLGSGLTQAQAIDSADISNTFIFVADGTNGLRSVRVSDKTAPTIERTVDTPGTAKDLLHTGNYIYVADGEAGLQILYYANDPKDMDIIGGTDTPGDAKGIDIWGSYVYIADGSAGLQIVDVRKPTEPSIVAHFPTVDASAVWVNRPADTTLNPGQKVYAYVADGTGGILTVDVTQPDSPKEVSGWSHDTIGTATDISVNQIGTRAVVADGKGGLSVLAFSDTQPVDNSDGESEELDNGCFIDTVL